MSIRSGGTSPSRRSTACTSSRRAPPNGGGLFGRCGGERGPEGAPQPAPGGELGRAERLGEECRAELLRFVEDALLAFSRQHDDRKCASRGCAPQLAQQIQPGAIREVEIEQQRVDGRARLSERRARLAQRTSETHPVPEMLEVGPEQ